MKTSSLDRRFGMKNGVLVKSIIVTRKEIAELIGVTENTIKKYFQTKSIYRTMYLHGYYLKEVSPKTDGTKQYRITKMMVEGIDY